MKCPLLMAAERGNSNMEIRFTPESDDCIQEKCAWWVPLIKPGPRGEKGACAIHYLGVFGI